MKYTFERTLAPSMASPGAQFYMNIVGAAEYNHGQAQHISGIVASGDTLTITLIQPQGEFLTLLAMPFLCAVPTSLPFTEVQAPVPSAGPYYIAEHTPNVSLVALRNPNYHGPRPTRSDSIEYAYGHTQQEIRQLVESGASDYSGDLAEADQAQLAQLYGPGSPAAAQGIQQWFANPIPCTLFMPLNTERSLFADPNMRKAVNYVIDRTTMAAVAGSTLWQPTDQLLPPGMPGFDDQQIYPNQADIEHARDLAGWHPGDPMRHANVYYRSSGTIQPALAQVVRAELFEIGIEPTMVPFAGSDIYTAISTRGEPFDVAVGVGWCQDYRDPWSFIQTLDGTTIHDGGGNINWSYFNDPVFNDRMHAAEQLVGQPRYTAFGQIDVDLMRDAAPIAAWGSINQREFVSRRIGCELYDSNLGLDLAAVCPRPEIVIDDTSAMQPPSGTTTATLTVHLSSEMDDPVSVDYATADGTAHAGVDYVATSGTLTFAPHERTGTLSVTVLAGTGGPKTFFVDLANQSNGTLVKQRAVATLVPGGPPPPPHHRHPHPRRHHLRLLRFHLRLLRRPRRSAVCRGWSG